MLKSTKTLVLILSGFLFTSISLANNSVNTSNDSLISPAESSVEGQNCVRVTGTWGGVHLYNGCSECRVAYVYSYEARHTYHVPVAAGRTEFLRMNGRFEPRGDRSC